MYAIVEIAGKQYKVAKNDKVEVDKLDVEKGKISFENVLLFAKDEKNVEIGNPYVSGAVVEADVIEQKKGDKLRVFKMKPKKRYQKTIGHRREITVLEIKDIRIGAQAPVKKAPVKEVSTKPEAKKPAAKKTVKKGE